MMSLSHQLAVLETIERHGVSQEEACDLVDEEGRAELADFLAGRVLDIDIDTLMTLAHALGMTVSQMIGV